MDASQRSMATARLANLKQHDNQHTVASIDATAVSQPDAAALLNVSRPSVQRAKVVLARGTPELIAATDAGKIAVSAAA